MSLTKNWRCSNRLRNIREEVASGTFSRITCSLLQLEMKKMTMMYLRASRKAQFKRNQRRVRKMTMYIKLGTKVMTRKMTKKRAKARV